ncbi:hypothetical protein ACFWP0_09235 [Achromobacter sp. NPDC058515]|uniref:hypothetical protein n=1 Tax=Achromobacter sp. NPDC058515 TaxID=3346533 RepID=UPI0036630880
MIESEDVRETRQLLDRLKAQPSLQGGGGPPNIPVAGGRDPGDNGGMEARVAKLEAAADFIQREISDLKTEVRGLRSDARNDFRMLFGALITVALGLAALMAKGFGWFS